MLLFASTGLFFLCVHMCFCVYACLCICVYGLVCVYAGVHVFVCFSLRLVVFLLFFGASKCACKLFYLVHVYFCVCHCEGTYFRFISVSALQRVYVPVFMFVCVSVCCCSYVLVYRVWMLVNLFDCMSPYMFACVCLYACMFVYACMRVCMCVCVCV